MTAVAKPAAKKLFSLSNVIFLVLCLVVMYVIFKNVAQIKAIDALFRQIDGYWITVAVVSQLLTYLSISGAYYLLLNKYNSKASSVRLPDMLKLSVVAVFINQIVPSGGIGGNGFLFNEFTKRGATQKRAFFVIVMECIYLYVSLGLLLIVLPALYLGFYHTLPHLFWIVIVFGLVLYGLLAGLMTVLSMREILQKVIKKLSRIKFLRHYLEDISFSPHGTFAEHSTDGPWGIFLKYKKWSVVSVLLQLGVFFADALTLFALLRGLHIYTSFLVISFGLVLTFVAAAIPISPGSLLLYEGAMTFFYTSMGMPFQTALVVTLMYRVLSFWAPVIIGLVLYKHVQKDPR